ncbi:MAG: phosphoribosylaminoimidazolesuccinocarboxamide synthase [Firmicutes bacterium]|nr:phosphoribosylaminoimidazolesuccinocarboxamide synthase [Bacillota bacterium]
MGATPLLTCPDLGLPLVHRGKVREVFDLGDRLLMVATDRLSAFDVVFPTGIPGKGRVLTQLSALWFRATRHLVPNHLITTDLEGLGLRPEHAALLAGRAMVVQKARRVDVEAVVRGYLAGSGWKEYQRTGAVCGVPLPPGLKMNARLPEPIFTPALKRDQGHDENITFREMVDRFGRELSEAIREVSLRLYTFAAERAARAGILLADTKFEFGLVDGRLILIDELLTPDSSRYWPADRYREGEPIDSLDKQPIRDWAETSGWNKEPPAPELPPDLVAETARRYAGVLERLEAVLG